MILICHQLLELAEKAKNLNEFLLSAKKTIKRESGIESILFLRDSEIDNQGNEVFPMAHTRKLPGGGLNLVVEKQDNFDRHFIEKTANMTGRIAWILHRNISIYEHLRIYKTVFENTGTGTIIIEGDMTISYANARFQEMTGYSREEIQGKKKWSEFIVAEDKDRMQQYHYGRRIEGNRIPSEYECRIQERYGRILDIYMKVGVIKGTDRSIASFLDISTRKQAELTLKQREAQLNVIIENFEGLIFIYKRDLRIDYVNRLLTERIGINAKGSLCEDVLPQLKELFNPDVQKKVFKGESFRTEIYCKEKKQWFYAINTPVFNNKGFVDKVQVILIDISQRKENEDVLKKREAFLEQENLLLRSELRDRHRFGDIIGKSSKMQDVYNMILKAAASSANVIILGESGTGKELVAQAIHKRSSRHKNPFIVVNCGAIPENLMESEFFGHLKGSFTGAIRDKKGYMEIADGGTLFLDEIGELPLKLQAKLLRAIEGGGFNPVGSNQKKKSDVRILAATNRDLREHMRKNLMREDFFYRIHIIPIKLPPLRERKEDIPLLLEYFVKKASNNENPPTLSENIIENFVAYDWPGNVRELQNALHRYLTLNKIDFSPAKTKIKKEKTSREKAKTEVLLKEAMENYEKEFIIQSLKKHNWHKGNTAKALGINRKTLFTKLRNLDIT